MSTDIESLRLRKILLDDGPALYNWVMDEETRRNAPSSEPFSLKTHMDWLQKKINDPQSFILIGEINNSSVGQVRFELEKSNNILVSIVINPTWRGKGFGKKMIMEAIQWLAGTNEMNLDQGLCTLTAVLKPSNLASKRIFEVNGFKPLSGPAEINGVEYYKLSKVIYIE